MRSSFCTGSNRFPFRLALRPFWGFSYREFIAKGEFSGPYYIYACDAFPVNESEVRSNVPGSCYNLRGDFDYLGAGALIGFPAEVFWLPKCCYAPL
jgi:hypothetical protein